MPLVESKLFALRSRPRLKQVKVLPSCQRRRVLCNQTMGQAVQHKHSRAMLSSEVSQTDDKVSLRTVRTWLSYHAPERALTISASLGTGAAHHFGKGRDILAGV